MAISIGHSVIGGIVLVAAAVGLTGWTLTSRTVPEARISLSYPEGTGAVVPLGLSAGDGPVLNVSATNPLQNDQTAVEEGKKLFRQMNCAGCHGYDAKGGMGPDLTDTEWRYGGTPIDLYKSIYEGRPQGMPAWGNALPPQTIWQMVSYIQSLGGTFVAPPPGTSQQAVADQGQGAQAGQKQ